MTIITITRGSYSRGKEVAEKLAERLGYRCLSRDIILEASEEFNIPEIKLVRALNDCPKVLDRFWGGADRYVKYFRATLLEHACKDNLVYHGLAGHIFLKDIPHVLKVRINADMKTRVAEEMRREKISAEDAEQILEQDDRERRKWSLQIYGTDPWDSRLYDMVISISSLTIDDAVDILQRVAEKPTFATTAQSQRLLDELASTARQQIEKIRKLGSTVF